LEKGFIRDNPITTIGGKSRMNQEQVYQWMGQIQQHMGMGKWQSLTLAAFSLGVMRSRCCTLSIVSEKLGVLGKADSVERRLQRWLDNEHLEREKYQADWVAWVLSKIERGGMLTLLVDETKLSDHMSIMVVGLAYERRCVPLTWRCYAPNAWSEGQVGLVTHLLQQVQAILPADTPVLVEADRGIGTSPDLVRAVRDTLHWHHLFRVQGTTHFQSAQQADIELRQLTSRGGQVYAATGQVFKDAGWLDSHVRVIWDAPYDDPWCLISDLPQVSGREYAKRNWQEQAFRDLKSGGWHWNNSQVWQPDHADRLLLVLALAYALTLALGLRLEHQPELRSQILRGRRRHYSWFRLGLRLLSALKRLAEPLLFWLDFRPPVPLRAFSEWLT
jgi:hypothetical protein